jgi:hypothetical protein
MGTSEATFIREVVLSEIRRAVRDAPPGAIVSTSACIDKVLQVYPSCWLTRRELEDMVIEQAAEAHVVLEIDANSPRGEASPWLSPEEFSTAKPRILN